MRISRLCLAAIASLAIALAGPGAAEGETINVAVAANFTDVAEALAPLFKAETGDDVVFSFGSTGQLYAQISQGAPYMVLLAADGERPARAVQEGLGIADSVFTYAVGALALYSPILDVSDGAAVLSGGDFAALAIADPVSAPYGRAAEQVITSLGLTDALAPRLVTGSSITQTLQFVESGNAELGFVARSQLSDTAIGSEHVWFVPPGLYDPIRQDAVLLEAGRDSAAARSFMQFLKGDLAGSVIKAAGYQR